MLIQLNLLLKLCKVYRSVHISRLLVLLPLNSHSLISGMIQVELLLLNVFLLIHQQELLNYFWFHQTKNTSNTTGLHTHCTFLCVQNRFQPQTSLWNYEKAILIKIFALFRNLLISSFDATIRVKRAFIYFKTRTSNDCEVMHSHAWHEAD